jgi:formylglycine-generating enzyme required for sulfatase activity
MEFILIPKGSFYMGDSLSKTDITNNELMHFVSISHDFWLAQTEVTQEQWQKVMGDEELHPDKPDPFYKDNPDYPVVSKSFYDVKNFIKRLEALSPGLRFRLPTEAEWEYACRAGTRTSFYTGTKLSDTLANFNAEIPSLYSDIGRKIGHPTKVGSYPPNQWGLYDMHGNVWEWVSDWYGQYSLKEETNPQGPPTGTLKVIRGGSWYFGADNARSPTRGTHDPQLWGFSIGFRIVCEKSEEHKPTESNY